MSLPLSLLRGLGDKVNITSPLIICESGSKRYKGYEMTYGVRVQVRARFHVQKAKGANTKSYMKLDKRNKGYKMTYETG